MHPYDPHPTIHSLADNNDEDITLNLRVYLLQKTVGAERAAEPAFIRALMTSICTSILVIKDSREGKWEKLTTAGCRYNAADNIKILHQT